MASVDFDSIQKEFLGALPSGFEGVKKFALQKVEITPLVGVQPFANKSVCNEFPTVYNW